MVCLNTHKTQTGIPPFRLIVDTTSTLHYNVRKFLASLLNPLTIDKYNLTDSFVAVSAIKAIHENLFEEGYCFVSFDVESLFTNVPLKQTINLVLLRVFKDKLINTTLSKHTLKKLLFDSCTKTAFSSDHILCQQIDVVSMGSCLAPVSANIIFTEFEKVIVDDLIRSGILKFYHHYVDDTIVLIKPADIPFVVNKFNCFDKNLNLTVFAFTFCNCSLHSRLTILTPLSSNITPGLYKNLRYSVTFMIELNWNNTHDP